MFDYKIIAHEENGHFWSSCPDIPEAHSVGDTLEELLENAIEGITLALSIYVDKKRQIPPASGAGEHVVSLPSVTKAKIVLWNQLVAQGKTKADLAAELGISPTAAGRLVDFEHKSKIEPVETALRNLGYGIAVTSFDPKAVIVQLYVGVNDQGSRTFLVKLPSTPMNALPDELREVYSKKTSQAMTVNFENIDQDSLLLEEDLVQLQKKGWSAFSVAPMRYN